MHTAESEIWQSSTSLDVTSFAHCCQKGDKNPSMSTPLIVVVDDHELIVDLYTDILESEGYRVVSWSTRQGAVAYIQHQQPDLVILDLWLETPTSGWEIYQELTDNPSTAGISIIISSAVPIIYQKPPAGLQDTKLITLPKPFAVSTLIETVKATLVE